MTVFNRLCRFVDWDWSEGSYTRLGRWSSLIGFVLAGGPLLILNYTYSDFAETIVGAGFALCLIWFCFVGWRVTRLIRAISAKVDRDFDKRRKFDLPPEYAKTESATASRRKRQKRPKGE